MSRILSAAKNGTTFTTPTNNESRSVRLPLGAVEALHVHRKRQTEEREKLGGPWGDHGLVFCSQVGTSLNRNNVHARSLTRQLTEQGQITERFTRAIDQLGKADEGEKNLETRLGGIYVLAQISRGFENYYSAIIDVLTAYVREDARRKTEADRAERVLLRTALLSPLTSKRS